MNEFIEKLSAQGTLTPEQVKDIESRVTEFVKAARKDPALRGEAYEKLGGFFDSAGAAARRFGSSTMDQMGAATASALALGVVGGTAGLASEAYKSVRESLDKAKAYKTMMTDAGDRISDLPAKQIQQSFDTLYRVNPAYANDPVVAAEFVRETNRSEAYPFQLLKHVQPDSRAGGGGMMDYAKLLPGSKTEDFQSAGSQAQRMRQLQDAKKEHGVVTKK